jgi:hypothetical protein
LAVFEYGGRQGRTTTLYRTKWLESLLRRASHGAVGLEPGENSVRSAHAAHGTKFGYWLTAISDHKRSTLAHLTKVLTKADLEFPSADHA